jgi:hypothetical protein
VWDVTGRDPEEFETIVRRYAAATPDTRPSPGGLARTLLNLAAALRTPALDRAAFAERHDLPRTHHTRFSGDSPDWRATHAPGAGAAGTLVRAAS